MTARPSSTHRGFTLVELLVVMAIIGIMAGLIVPAARTIASGNQLTQAAESLNGAFGLARQSALTKNRTTEVRLYRYADSSFPGEIKGTASTGKYRAFQLFEYDDAGNAKALTKVVTLPRSIIMDSGTISSLMGDTQTKTWNPPSDPQVPLPSIGTAYDCKAFKYRRDGSTDLSSSGQWYVTVHESTKGDNLTTPPQNYATLLIDPISGSVKSFRP